MSDRTHPEYDERTRSLAKEAASVLASEGLLPPGTTHNPNDVNFAYLLRITRFLEPDVSSTAELVAGARAFFVDELDYTDAQLLGTKLYASDARALLHRILEQFGADPQAETWPDRFEQATRSAVDSLNLDEHTSLGVVATALLGRPVDASRLFGAAAVLGAERVRTR